MIKRQEDFLIVVLVLCNSIGFLIWALFYSFNQDYIKHFMFDILCVPFYPRVFYNVFTIFLHQRSCFSLNLFNNEKKRLSLIPEIRRQENNYFRKCLVIELTRFHLSLT